MLHAHEVRTIRQYLAPVVVEKKTDELDEIARRWHKFSNARRWILETRLSDERARKERTPATLQALSAALEDLKGQAETVRRALVRARSARPEGARVEAAAARSLVEDAERLAPGWERELAEVEDRFRGRSQAPDRYL